MAPVRSLPLMEPRDASPRHTARAGLVRSALIAIVPLLLGTAHATSMQGAPLRAPDEGVAAARTASIERAKAELEAGVEAYGGFEAIRQRLVPFRAHALRVMDAAKKSKGFFEQGRFAFHAKCNQAALEEDWGLEAGGTALAAVGVLSSVRQRLAEHGVDLIVVPVPAKVELYAGEFEDGVQTFDLPDDFPYSPERDRVLLRLLGANVEVVDVVPTLRTLIAAENESPVFERNGHHLSGLGVSACGELVAERLERYSIPGRDKAAYSLRKRLGREARLPTPMDAWEVLRDGERLRRSKEAPVIVIGDSHANVHGNASWSAHIERSAGVPVLDLAISGGSDSADQRLFRLGPAFLEQRQVVIWILTSASLAQGGWSR